MKDRFLKIARWVAYPFFYLVCLALFGYLTFPYDRLKDRIIAEVEQRGKPGMRLEIGRLSSYWVSGIEFSGVKLVLPPDDGGGPMGGMALPRSGEDFNAAAAAMAPKEASITIDEGHARLQLLPLLLGRVRLNFWASALGGEVEGSAPIGSGDVELNVDKIEIGKIEPLVQKLGIPLKGIATGKFALSAVDGKFSKANGTMDFTIDGVVVGDGKAKIAGLIELPAAKLGTLLISAEAKDGSLKINKLSATGTDLELVGDGKVALREQLNDCIPDVYVRFKFTDAYRTKNDTTKSLLGEPGSTLPGLIEMQVPKMKRAKRTDGFYGWHVTGPIKVIRFEPSSVDLSPSAGGAAASAKGRSKIPDWKRPSGFGAPGDDGASKPPDLPPPQAADAPAPAPGPTPRTVPESEAPTQ